jgi:hypothetical protein
MPSAPLLIVPPQTEHKSPGQHVRGSSFSLASFLSPTFSLRLASLSSTMIYAHAPTGTVILTAVYVFEEATGPAPPPQLAAGPSAEDRREEASSSFADALAQLSTPLPPPSEVGQQDGVERFRALLESAKHYAASPGAGEENELARRFREALEQPLQPPDDTSPSDLPRMEYQE